MRPTSPPAPAPQWPVTLLTPDGPAADDPWADLADGAPPPPTGDLILPLARFLEDPTALQGRQGRLGVKLEPADSVEALAPHVRTLGAIWLVIPKFRDGRAYSAAHLLRRRFRFEGLIRAVGDVLRDQLKFMLQCGINEFALRDPDPSSAALLLKTPRPRPYQSVLGGEEPVFAARRNGGLGEDTA